MEQARLERNVEINNETRLHQISTEEARLKQEREIEDERPIIGLQKPDKWTDLWLDT